MRCGFVKRWLCWWGVPSVLLFAGIPLSAAEPAAATPDAPAAESAAAAPDPFWLGIGGAPVDTLLKSHLKLDAGLVVEHVVPDSPAAKAGLKENDILLKFGDVQVADVQALADAVAKNRDREVKLVLLREGQEQTLTVTPEKRPADFAMPVKPQGEWDMVNEWLKKMQKGEHGDDPMRMFFVHPGIVMPKDMKARIQVFGSAGDVAPMPKDMSVSITRTGDEPAKITVRKGDQTWEVTEKELDKLPDDVRPIVQRMLGGPVGVRVFGGSVPGGIHEMPVPKVRAMTPQAKVLEAPPTNLDGVQKKLEEMTRQLREHEKRLQRELDELRESLERMKQQ